MAAENQAGLTGETTGSLSGGGSESFGGGMTRRRLSELRVIDLRAELKHRNLDSGGNKSVLLERLRKAIEEEGECPDEILMVSEMNPKRTPKRSSKGRKPEEEGAEDNGLLEESGEAQEDIEASLDNLQDIDMMDISVLDEAAIDNSSGVDCQEDNSADSRLDSLFDSKQSAEAERRGPPEQLAGCAVGTLETAPPLSDITEESREIPVAMAEKEEASGTPDISSADVASMKELEEFPLEPENEKMLDILGDTCKSEFLKEDASEAEQAQEANDPLPSKKAAEEEEEEGMPATAAAQSDEDFVDTDSQSGQAAAKNQEDEAKLLVLAKGEPSEQRVEETQPDSVFLAVESRSGGGGGESSGGDQTLEASSEETAESDTGPQVVSPEAEKMEVKANCEEESSAQEAGDQKTSSEESRDPKLTSKEEKGRSSASTGRNFWVSGLASSTRATDLKNLFSKYGKVVGAKVVTNARSPGARCYGFVTMSTAEETTKCITHCHKTELHGKIISVERAKNEPATKKLLDKKDSEVKTEISSGDRSSSVKKNEKTDQKEDSSKADEKEEKGKEEQKSGSTDQSKSSKSGSKGTERTVVMDKSKGEPVISVKTTRSKERSVKSQDRKSESREKSRERQGSVPFNKTRDKRSSEEHRSSRDRRERQRLQAIWEQEESERLEITREKLEFERTRLERERMERERLERERMFIEHERRREQERIQREREELRRQHEQLRYDQERRVALRRPYDMDGRRDDPYWPEAKRMAIDERHRSDFSRQDRFHDFDHRERGRYQEHPLDRREGSRGMMGDRDRQHYADDRHGDPDRHSRDGWAGYGSDRRLSEGRRIPSRDGRDWGDHVRKFEGHPDRSWPGNDGGAVGRDHDRWRGGGRGRRGHVIHHGGMSGRGGFIPSGSQEQAAQGEGFSGQERGNRPSDPRFSRHY